MAFNKMTLKLCGKSDSIQFISLCALAFACSTRHLALALFRINKFNDLLYMSKLPVPGIKSLKKPHHPDYKKQVCIYAFTQEELKAFGNQQEKSKVEGFEDIEMLRFFELNIPIKMVKTSGSSLAVDIIQDVVKVEAELIKLEGKDKG